MSQLFRTKLFAFARSHGSRKPDRARPPRLAAASSILPHPPFPVSSDADVNVNVNGNGSAVASRGLVTSSDDSEGRSADRFKDKTPPETIIAQHLAPSSRLAFFCRKCPALGGGRSGRHASGGRGGAVLPASNTSATSSSVKSSSSYDCGHRPSRLHGLRVGDAEHAPVFAASAASVSVEFQVACAKEEHALLSISPATDPLPVAAFLGTKNEGWECFSGASIPFFRPDHSGGCGRTFEAAESGPLDLRREMQRLHSAPCTHATWQELELAPEERSEVFPSFGDEGVAGEIPSGDLGRFSEGERTCHEPWHGAYNDLAQRDLALRSMRNGSFEMEVVPDWLGMQGCLVGRIEEVARPLRRFSCDWDVQQTGRQLRKTRSEPI
ncbi:hypothetical protein CLOP_g2275 [Closterium sp. NIES-67]|nr:hypothetical protein CLOP_g2275 [Closterium sp. NIES-67]